MSSDAKLYLSSIAKRLFSFALLFLFVLLVNRQVISFNLVYQEQAELYIANLQVNSFHDMLNIYLHPNMLNVFYIPFFRPSGHFLIYKLLMPILGWHNNQGMIVVNLFFLAMTGYYLVKLYRLLFPGFIIGGYIAFAIYLMHPALILSRMIVLHFEFAYVFMVVLSTYYFSLFIDRNVTVISPTIRSVTFRHLKWFIISLFVYAVAITFKEAAIMLGPVLALYLCISLYDGQKVLAFSRDLYRNKRIRDVFLLLTIVSLILGFYLSLQWPTLSNPVKHEASWKALLSSSNELIKILLASPYNFIPGSWYDLQSAKWRDVIFPASTRVLIWSLIIITMFSIVLVKKNDSVDAIRQRKSLLFLFLSALIYLVLPIGWGMSLPWHLSLSLVCLCMLAGFSVEYLERYVTANPYWVTVTGGFVTLLIGINTIPVNKANISYVQAKYGMELALARNALLNPPDIKNKLNKDSVIVVEGRTYQDGYSLGNYYPLHYLYTIGTYDIHLMEALHSRSYFKFQSIYAGTYFRWAYLMPILKEEVVPFQINKMNKVPDIVLYKWLQNFQNIFCIGYDDAGNWQDRTEEFKLNIVKENLKRHLITNDYRLRPNVMVLGNQIGQLELALPEPALCQLQCDKRKDCAAFTFVNAEYPRKPIRKCVFYSVSKSNQIKSKACKVCTQYTKLSKVTT